jgi:hypothetical protein
MCELCGCSQYIEQGKEVVLERVTEVVKELALTSKNVADYEDTEIISGIIAPFDARDEDIYQAAIWISSLHMGLPTWNEPARALALAFRDIFSRLPVQGDPKHVVTIYHQLEQFGRVLADADLTSLDPETRRAMQAMSHVHDNLEARVAELKEQYSL